MANTVTYKISFFHLPKHSFSPHFMEENSLQKLENGSPASLYLTLRAQTKFQLTNNTNPKDNSNSHHTKKLIATIMNFH